MHLSFAYVGFVLAASAAATSHHQTRGNAVARLNARSDLNPTTDTKLNAKCFGGPGCNGLGPPGASAMFNQPVVVPVGVMPQNQFFSTVQSYTAITSNTVNFWGGGADIQTILFQWQVLVVSFSTLLAGFQGGCPYQGNPQIVISTFAPLFIQFQSMLTIITQVSGGNFGPFQASFGAFSVLMQAFIGIAISMQVNLQQFFSACQFNPSIWQTCGFPASAWLSGQPGVFGQTGFGGAGGGFPGVPGSGPNGVVPGGIPGGAPGGFVPGGGPPGGFVPGGLVPGGGGGGVIAFFSGLSSLGQLLIALINVLEPVLKGLDKLLRGVGLLLGNLGNVVGGLLGGPSLGFI